MDVPIEPLRKIIRRKKAVEPPKEEPVKKIIKRKKEEPKEKIPEKLVEPIRKLIKVKKQIDKEEAKMVRLLKEEDILPKKSFDEQFKEYINEIVNGEGDPFRIDYTSAGFIVDYILIYLLNKYKNSCGVFIDITSRDRYTQLVIDEDLRENDSKLSALGIVIGKRIRECILNGSKIVAIPIGYMFEGTDSGHQNMFLYRAKQNSIEHYEPAGNVTGVTNNYANSESDYLMKNWVELWEKYELVPKGVKIIAKNELCPTVGHQFYETKFIEEIESGKRPKKGVELSGGGFCQMWSLFYFEMCLKFPEKSGKELYAKSIEELKKMGEENFVKHIVRYTHNLNKELKKYTTKNIDITSEKLLKNNKLLKEIETLVYKNIKQYIKKNVPVAIKLNKITEEKLSKDYDKRYEIFIKAKDAFKDIEKLYKEGKVSKKEYERVEEEMEEAEINKKYYWDRYHEFKIDLYEEEEEDEEEDYIDDFF